MYDFLSYGSYNNNEMSGVYVRFTSRYHTKPRHFKQWSMKAAARSSCPAPRSREIKREKKGKKRKERIPPHYWLPAWKRTRAGKLWMAMMESPVQLLDLKTLGIYPEYEDGGRLLSSPTTALLLFEARVSQSLISVSFAMVKVEWNQSMTRRGTVNSIPCANSTVMTV